MHCRKITVAKSKGVKTGWSELGRKAIAEKDCFAD
jgi:hypothetical protein